MPRPRLFWRSVVGLALALIVPLAGCVIADVVYPDVVYAQIPLHSLVESLGGLAALAIAAILVAERERRESHDFYVCMAVALMGMGVLDAFHAATQPGNSFVWLHTLATFVGGALFATVWCPSEWLRGKAARWSPLLILVATSAVGVLSIAFSEYLPPMIEAGQFTRAARFLNFAGGAGFLAAGSFFIVRYHRYQEEEDWLFAVHTVLFGAAGLLFEFSTLWDLAWWWWHLLRLAAYVVALVYAARKFWEAERAASQANRQLADLNRGLDDLVAQRTNELRATEERYRLSVRGSNDGLWDWIVTTGEVFYSARFRELLGYSEQEFPDLFDSFESRLHPDDHAHTLAAVEAHLQRHEPYDVEYRLKTSDGEYRWFRARGQALWNDAGQATRMAGSITDVTDRKQAEMALQHERFLLQTLLSNLPDAIYFKDLEGRFLRVSDSLARHLGVNSPEEVHGKTDADFFPPVYAAQARADELEMQATGQSLRAKEEHPQWVNGTDSYVLTTKLPLREPTGEIIGTFGISRDITSVKEAQVTLVRAKEAAEAANRAKSDFLA
ncbi:MAG: PAS domain S-box protein, partial [Planctomycetales bacterium]|nr:PAS domain S-box protein [Planctomycetales bacterium]